jgi:hypothetical protein
MMKSKQKNTFFIPILLIILIMLALTPTAKAAGYIEIVSPKYGDVGSFSDGLAWVALNGKYGFIDKTGKEVIPLKYDSAYDFSGGLAVIELDEKRGFIDKTGKEVVPPKYYSAHSFSDGLALVTLNDKVGFIDMSGEEVIPCEYYYNYPVTREEYAYRYSCSDGIVMVTDGTDQLGYIDKTGNMIVPIGKYSYGNFFSDGMAAVQLDTGKWGYIDITGKEVLPCEYGAAKDFSEGLALVRGDSRGMYKDFFIDKTGKEIFALKGDYSWVQEFSDSMAKVVSDGGYGFIDRTGTEVVPPKYMKAKNFSEGMAAVFVGVLSNDSSDWAYIYDGKWGFIDKTGKEAIPLKYNYVGSFSEGIAQVNIGGKYYEGEWSDWAEGGKWGFIDKAGKVIVPCKYDNTQPLSEGLAAVAINDKWGFISIFTDQNPISTASDWARGDILSALAKGLIPSNLQNNYKNITTRAEFCAFAVALYETVQGAEISDRMSFNDTNDVNVQKLGALGVVIGVGNDNFAPSSNLTREQAATMLARLAEAIGKPLPKQVATFADNGSITSCALESVGQMQASGIIIGTGNNMFSPQGPYTREQSIVTILRLYYA